MSEQEYFCKVCGVKLEMKNGLLFCHHCNIYMGKPETFSISYDTNELNTNVILSGSTNENKSNSVFYAVYAFASIAVGIGIVLYNFLPLLK